jgi:hypothetical protein
MTPDTFGHGSQMELPFADLDSAFSRTLKDTFRWDSPQSSAIWKKWVTERRGAYSQRLKLAHLTNESGSLSWPTVQTCEAKSDTLQDRKARGKQVMLCHAVRQYGPVDPANHNTDGSHPELWATKDGAWTTPAATDTGRTTQYQQGGKALSMQAAWATPRAGKTTDENPETWALRQAKGEVATMPLTAQVKAWPTATASDHKDGRESYKNRKDNKMSGMLPAAVKDVQAWLTPRANEPDSDKGFVARNADRGEHCHGSLSSQAKTANQGKLNPRWVETLMGVPIGWTMPSCTSPVTIAPTNSGYLETESCQPQQSELF